MALPLGRIGLSALVIVVFRFVSAIVQPIVATQLAAAAGDQFQNSDFAFVRVSSFIAMLGGVSFLCWVIPVVLLMCIWWGPVSRLIDRVMALALVLGFLAAPQAHAYYSATDVTEAYGILPNHSAFWVPGMGDTKGNQALPLGVVGLPMGFSENFQRVTMLVFGGLPGIVHTAPEQDSLDQGKKGSGEKAAYSQPLSKAIFALMGMLLMTGSLLLTRHAVERTDYLHVVLVLLAFLPFSGGGFLLAYSVGIFPAP